MLRTLLTSLAMLLASPAHSAIIDFEAEDGAYDRFPRSFVEDGFKISYETGIFGFNLIDNPAEHLGMCTPDCPSSGTTALYAFNDSTVTFELVNGGLFSLDSLDIAQTFTGENRLLDVTLTGLSATGVVTQNITLGVKEAESFSSFKFTGFDALSSLKITGSQAFPDFAIDNVGLSTSAVPEPATWILMIAGFGIVGAALRRRSGQVRYV